ncbi:NAD(P)/FAD-dependent oxidoreductase [Mesorhizobium kowhaii]|uniref:FAD/NAD(P)-binding oxidoreductase n=1 Tax=Mesorhizobium kowhaii TaxID=1300272 RepID=A0A2W7BVV0_9HYPH|nr:FAD/NAD(P)-binding oxidoreductase [Mesorhizobium kowhaii]PZV34707.1 FAD/NAD(P)-binding oxidoreductase [Mesorhizobium kowhaii]
MAEPRIVIVGAGPAGVRAAETLVASGVRPIVIDEGGRDGGQIYRRQPEGFRRSYASLYGSEAGRAEDMHRSFDALRDRIDYRPETLAWGIWEKQLHLLQGSRTSAVDFDALIIASGATDRLMPVRGWNRAGVYSMGAAQIALKSQATAIGKRVVFMGSGPLLYLVAAQYSKAGAEVAAVLDTSPFHLRVKALPQLIARPDVLLKGLALTLKLRRGGIEIQTGITPVEIEGRPEIGVETIRFRTSKGKVRTIACDAVALGYHLRPEAQLADLARCEFRFDAQTRQFFPVKDADGRSSVAGVYLAGDGALTLGADAAEVAGRLAALAVLSDLGRQVAGVQVARLRRRLRIFERFRRGIAAAFPWPAGAAAALGEDTVVCRCENITAGELRAAVSDNGAVEINRAKAFSRVGMGRCQGRYCGHAAAEVIAACAGVPVEAVGRIRAQAPVKPLIIGAESDAEQAA